MHTMIGQLAPGSAQLLAYINTWSTVNLAHFESNPLDADLNRVDTVGALTPDRTRHLMATTFVERTTELERRLYDTLELPFPVVKRDLERGVGLLKWMQRHRDAYPWMKELNRSTLVCDSLHQVHNVKNLIETRLDRWQSVGDYAAERKVLNKLYVLLSALIVSRVRLGRHVADMNDITKLAYFFAAKDRPEFGVYTATQSARVYLMGGSD